LLNLKYRFDIMTIAKKGASPLQIIIYKKTITSRKEEKMSEFLDNLAKQGKALWESALSTASDLAESAKDTANDLIDQGKDKAEELKLKGQQKDLFQKLGEMVYNEVVNGEEGDKDSLLDELKNVAASLVALDEKRAAALAAKETVADAVEDAKEVVEETVEDAKEEVDKAVDTVGEIKDSIEEAIESVEDKAEEATITCPVCGVVLPAGTKVCPVCGVELD
jgi:rubrerythrin